MKDTDLMPYGAHKGKQMADVPDEYLLWLYNENKASPQVRLYIHQNLEAIKTNLDRKKGIKR